jgi:hypothetical protein
MIIFVRKMKIGILFTVYNCDKYLTECLSPWFELKEKYNFIFCSNSGMFSDYLTLGLPYRNEKTLEILNGFDLDFSIVTKGINLLAEDESRNMCLNYLNKIGCDIIWVLDGDEIYTKNQIINMMEFIQKNPSYDCYSVNFKNLTIYNNLFLDYTHERIFWTNRYGGISYFYFDNRFIYNDGVNSMNAKTLEIPKSVAYITHNSWLSDDTRTLDKIEYQNLRYAGVHGEFPIDCRCSFEWNHEKNRIDFSEKFHSCRNIEIPVLKEGGSIYSTDFTINFSRNNNTFYITKIERSVDAVFELFNDSDTSLMYSCEMSLSRGVEYFIFPGQEHGHIDDNKNFHAFRIKVYEHNKLIHDEKIHLILK